jgi:ArsR family transcriptional regulator
MPDLLHVHKALADPTRLRLVRLLARGPLSVNEIIEVLRMGQSRVSRHLKILAEAGLVSSRRQGTWIYYQATPADPDPLVADVVRLVQQHEHGVARYTEDLQSLEAVIERRREQTRTFFDSITDPDALHQLINGDQYRQVALSLLPEHCGTVVDLGTGAGLLLPGLLARADRAIAVDASTTMLELARRTVAADAPRCDFRLGDLNHLPVADREADAVMACMVLHHLSDPRGALAEARRVLRPGGWLTIVDLRQHEDESLRDRMADLWLGFAPEEIEGWLRELGFTLAGIEIVGQPGRHPLIAVKGQQP